MNKTKIIDEAKKYLATQGIKDSEYVMSLQGPTLIPTTAYLEKTKNKPHIKIHLKSIKVKILTLTQ
jgi:hypothetical protein